MITFAFAALTLLLVERHLVRGGKAIWVLVPLFLVWSNFHSGFVIGLGFIAIDPDRRSRSAHGCTCPTRRRESDCAHCSSC